MNHRLTTQGRIVKTGIQNFFRNATLAVAAIAVMAITLTIILFSVIANATFTNTVTQITDRIDVSFFLKDEVTDQQREGFISELNNRPDVESVTYRSKDQVLAQYKEDNKDNTDTLLAISQTENPLPATINIKPTDPTELDGLRAFLAQKQVVALQSDSVNDGGTRQTAVDNITGAAVFFQRAGLVGVLVFTFVSILIIFNTIRMTIFNRRDELTIMRLLGASSWYIRGPFVVETIIYGLVSALLSVGICQLIFAISTSAFGASSLGLLDISFASTYFSRNFIIILTSQLAVGILIGAASSAIATQRYLKFKTSK